MTYHVLSSFLHSAVTNDLINMMLFPSKLSLLLFCSLNRIRLYHLHCRFVSLLQKHGQNRRQSQAAGLFLRRLSLNLKLNSALNELWVTYTERKQEKKTHSVSIDSRCSVYHNVTKVFFQCTRLSTADVCSDLKKDCIPKAEKPNAKSESGWKLWQMDKNVFRNGWISVDL